MFQGLQHVPALPHHSRKQGKKVKKRLKMNIFEIIQFIINFRSNEFVQFTH